MAYTPLNINVFTAAYVGALAGISSGRALSSATAANYAVQAAAASAFAQSLDTAFTAVVPTEMQVGAIQMASAAYFDGRAALSATVANYATATAAILAMVTQAGTQYTTTDGVTSPSSQGGNFKARGVVFADVANLAAFTVAGNDGLTYTAGQRVLLANQTTAAQCGLYVCGTVGGGTCALTRAPEMPSGMTGIADAVVEVSEGTIFKGSSWKAICAATVVVGTTDPNFYPRVCKGILTLASGTYTLGVTEALFLLSVTTSVIHACMNTPGGTLTLTVGGYGSNSAGRTAGKSGTGAAIVIARVAAGTIDTANNSTVDWLATNW